MTLKDLLMNGLVRDDENIKISMSVFRGGSAAEFRRGNWFNDGILDWMDKEIERFSWDFERGYSIKLKDCRKEY